MDNEIKNASAYRLLLHSFMQLFRMVRRFILAILSDVAWDWLGVAAMLVTLSWQLLACFAFFGVLGFLAYAFVLVAVCSRIISGRKCQT
jgi:membrane protein implicated in regulation of membrane protease activity